MRTTPLTLGLLALLALGGATGCAGSGRPSAQDIISRLNSAGVDCASQDARLALPSGGATERSCLTPDGREIGVQTYASDDDQKALLDRIEAALSGSVFPYVVYDFGYVLLVPDVELGRRVARVMDAQSYQSVSVTPCPTARNGVCPPGG